MTRKKRGKAALLEFLSLMTPGKEYGLPSEKDATVIDCEENVRLQITSKPVRSLGASMRAMKLCDKLMSQQVESVETAKGR